MEGKKKKKIGYREQFWPARFLGTAIKTNPGKNGSHRYPSIRLLTAIARR